ncbi:MAG: AMP-binding protein [Actinomycetia bacterium]|nr:AMP-binding protein [Actinomycetes bacterium]
MRPWIQWYGGLDPAGPDPDQSVGERFWALAAADPAAPAIHYFDRTLTRGELWERARRLAGALRRLGVGPGDRVAAVLQNVPAFVALELAVWARGAIVVPLNVMLREEELAHHLADAEVRLVVGLASLAGTLLPLARRFGVPLVVVDDDEDGAPADAVPAARAPADPAVVAWRDLLAEAPDAAFHRPAPDDVAYLHYTSGTTGPPKGAMNTHRNVAVNAEAYARWCHVGPDDVNLAIAPVFHITGSIAGIAASLWTGAPLVLLYRFEPRRALEAIERRRVTFGVGAVTAYLALLNQPDAAGRDWSAFTKAFSGGAPVSPAVAERFRTVTGQRLHNIYGLTETTSPATGVPWGVDAPVDPASGALSVGVPLPGYDARIVDVDDRARTLGPGEVGELALKGPAVVPGYWRKPEETARAIVDGWLYTGDVAVMDPAGWIFIVDRKKDMIIASGYKVWPREVEDVLWRHPAVREAVVVGEPDPYRGESPVAYVALHPDRRATAEELLAHLREHLAAYKVPRRIEFVDEVPKTATGKFLRRALRKPSPAP